MKAKHEFQNEEQWLDYLRTYFSAMAMQGLLVRYKIDERFSTHPDYPMVAIMSVREADALINALNQTEK